MNKRVLIPSILAGVMLVSATVFVVTDAELLDLPAGRHHSPPESRTATV